MTMPPDHARRVEILRAHGASHAAALELVTYADSGFEPAALSEPHAFPLADEPFVAAWAGYAREARTHGAVSVLRRVLLQLRFPVAAGMSECPAYRDATRRGIAPAHGEYPDAPFADPAGVQIIIHDTPAGRLPVVVTSDRQDFELLIRALTRRNEPEVIPPSMGACIVGGYNNWARVAELRRQWAAPLELAGTTADEPGWQAEFKRIVPHREHYQDRFVILSTGPYSGTPASEVGLPDDEWLRLSHRIRLEHECAHYFTRRVFGSMRNSLLDELVADYTGIVAARGSFEPRWLMRFMGVDRAEFRPDGRLVNYRGTPPLGDEAFRVLQRLVRSAAASIAAFDDALRRDRSSSGGPAPHDEVAWAITAIATLGLEQLTAPGAADALHAEYLRQAADRYAMA